MAILLQGDNASIWLPFAKAMLRNMKRLMMLGGRNMMSETRPLPSGQGEVFVSFCVGQENIRIKVVGVGFLVMGYIEDADDVRYFGVPGKGQKYLFLRFNSSVKQTAKKSLGSIAYPFAGADWNSNDKGEHRIDYLSDTFFYTGKMHDFRFVDDDPARVYQWQIRKFSYDYSLKYEVTEPSVEGSAVVFHEDSDATYVYGERLVRDPDPEIWYMASRTEKRMKNTGELVWQYDFPVYWNQSRGKANATHLFLSYAVLMYNPGTGHDQYFPTIVKQDKNTGAVIWFVQNDPGVYAGIGGWSVNTGYLVDADIDFHYVAWLEWQNPAPALGYMLRFRVSKISNEDGVSVEWTTEHVLPFAVEDSSNMRIVSSVRHGKRITYCGVFVSYPEGYNIRIAFCLDISTGEIVWHKEYTPDGTFNGSGHIIKGSGFYNDVKHDKKKDRIILAGADDPDVELNMTTAIVDIRNPETGTMMKTERSTNSGLFIENVLVHVMNEASA